MVRRWHLATCAGCRPAAFATKAGFRADEGSVARCRADRYRSPASDGTPEGLARPHSGSAIVHAYSASATIGSIRVARRAGSAHAATATSARSARHGDEHERIGRADAEQLALEALAQRDGADRAEHEAAADQHQPFAQHQLEDRPRAAAERDANADLLASAASPGTRARRRCRSPTGTARRAPKLSDSSDRRSPADQRLLHPLLHRLRVEHRQLAVELR